MLGRFVSILNSVAASMSPTYPIQKQEFAESSSRTWVGPYNLKLPNMRFLIRSNDNCSPYIVVIELQLRKLQLIQDVRNPLIRRWRTPWLIYRRVDGRIQLQDCGLDDRLEESQEV